MKKLSERRQHAQIQKAKRVARHRKSRKRGLSHRNRVAWQILRDKFRGLYAKPWMGYLSGIRQGNF